MQVPVGLRKCILYLTSPPTISTGTTTKGSGGTAHTCKEWHSSCELLAWFQLHCMDCKACTVTLCGAARHCLVHSCPDSASDPHYILSGMHHQFRLFETARHISMLFVSSD